MLLTVVHANGLYHTAEGLNEPLMEMPDGFHEKLARLATRHVNNEQPVAYLPYWSDVEATGIHGDLGLQEAALDVDPFYRALAAETRPLINVIPDAPDLSSNFQIAQSRDRKLDALAKGQKTVCFVGAYAGACVLQRAVEMHDRAYDRPHIFIDPDYCVDLSSCPVSKWSMGWMGLDRYSRYSE